MESKKRSKKEKKHKKRHRESRSPSPMSEGESRNVKPGKKRSEESSGPKTEDKSSLSIEETNKLRAMLGLKPLQAPPASGGAAAAQSSSAAKSTATVEVFVKTRNMGEEKETERIKQKLELAKEKRRVADYLISDRPLGEDESVDDISSWVHRSREQELAKQREKLLAEADEQVAVQEPAAKPEKASYSSQDLAGLRVQHSLDRIKDERSLVLTLKDRPVLGDDDDEGDVLENVNIADEERAELNMANKKSAEAVSGFGVVRYRPYDDEDGTNPILLGKYDEEIYGRKKEYFVLDGSAQDGHHASAASSKPEKKKAKPVVEGSGSIDVEQPKMDVDMDPLEELRARLRMPTRPTGSLRPAMLATTSLNDSGPTLASEYFTQEEMAAKFKKVRKVRKPVRALKADDLIEIDKEVELNTASIEEDGKPITTADRPPAQLVRKTNAQNFEPSDAGLEAIISRTKKLREWASDSATGTKFSRRLPEHVAVDLLAQTTLQPSTTTTTAAATTGASTSGASVGGWVLINQTSEFCRGIGDLPTIVAADEEKEDSSNRSAVDMAVEDGQSSTSDASDSGKRNGKSKSRSYRKHEDSDEEGRRGRKTEAKSSSSAPVKSEPMESDDEEDEEDILGAEPKAASSIGEALRLAAMKGYLEKSKESGGGATVIGKVSQLQARSFTVEERNHGDIDAKFSGGRGNRGGHGGPRGSGGPVVEFCEKSTYHPDVKLEYINEAGKSINQKEAFRLLSHRFHGKTSGKRKVERRLRKEAQERRILSQPCADTPLGTLGRLVARQQKEKSAHVVLSSSGTTGSVSISVPSTSESPAKPKAKSTKKAAAAAAASVKPA